MSGPVLAEKGLPARLLTALVCLLTVAYPFAIYFGMERLGGRGLALILLTLFGFRLLLLRGASRAAVASFAPLLLAVTAICLLVLWRGDTSFFLYYPVLVNLTMLVSFAYTLHSGPTMIERFARLREPNLPPEAIAYCRNVTRVWCVFFSLNGALALATAQADDLRLWTFYNGFLAYLLMALLFTVEYAVRRIVKNRILRS